METSTALADQTHTPRPGYVDFYGYHSASRAWLFCGWISIQRNELPKFAPQECEIAVTFEQGFVSGVTNLSYFTRDDLGSAGFGICAYLSYSDSPLGRLVSIDLTFETATFRVMAAGEAIRLREADILGRMFPILGSAFNTPSRTNLLNMMKRKGYGGQDTLASLSDKIFLEVDEVVVCPPDGVFILGWRVSEPNAIVSIRLCGINEHVELDIAHFIRIERHDVVSALVERLGWVEPNCGFLTFAGNVSFASDPLYLEIETKGKEVGYKPLPQSRLRGMPAIRRILDAFEVRWGDVMPALDHVVGPGITLLNANRMRDGVNASVLQFGAMPSAPKYSVIVPLYGRLDFMEFQLALMPGKESYASFDLIYVLDDPPKRRELEDLAESIHARFGIPFRIVLLDKNMGFAPANNVGLRYAVGEFLCYLNSDVFPDTPQWMERLSARLEANPDIGAVGPLLLFEDGSVQHEGMTFERMPIFGNIPFPMHSRKGLRPRSNPGLERVPAITGACMVLRRALARELGGFDESFVIGDFEDTDLCLQLRARNLMCAVDQDVRMFHLERKSQIAPSHRWRHNMTLFNAWTHQQRWMWI